MDRHRPLIAALFAGMYSRATTENDGLALARKTAYAFELAFFGKRPTEIPQLTVGRIQINFHHVVCLLLPSPAFLTAMAIAQQQKARSFELRAAMSLARLWRDQGKPQQARELLAPVYGLLKASTRAI